MDFDGFKLVINCGNQKNLRASGPMLPGAWSGFSDEEAKYVGQQGPMPNLKSVQGYFLIDTAAGHVGIDSDVVKGLGLTPTGKKQEIFGVGHRTIANRRPDPNCRRQKLID